MLKSGKDHKDRGISGISEHYANPILVCMRLQFVGWLIAIGSILVGATPMSSGAANSFLGTFQGTLRNASGVLQLGGADATKSVVTLKASADSLLLEAMDKTGSIRRIAAWPMARVKVAGDVLAATGFSKGALHLRRSLSWKRSGGIRVSAELTTSGASQREDDYFGGSRVMLTLLKIR